MVEHYKSMDDLIEFDLWTTHEGRCYVGDFLLGLDGVTRERVRQKLEDYEKYSLMMLLKDQKIKKIQKNLFSVRILVKGEYFRFFGNFRGKKLVLVHAFKKKSDQIPARELQTAEFRINQI